MHEDHRKRMRERFRISGFDGFADHEILETLLYFCFPRGDTNELAHRLLERFGSVRNIMEASPDELTAVDGIGEQSAFLIQLVTETMRRYARDTLTNVPTYRTLGEVSEYLCRKFVGCSSECVYLMLLNNRLSLIDCCKISEGTVNHSLVPIRKITEKAVFKKASVVILAHNHPNGAPVPSQSDLEVTSQISMMLHTLGVPLLEHLIIADDYVYPILGNDLRKTGQCEVPESILRTDANFLEHFYDIDPKTWRFSFYRDLAAKQQKGEDSHAV